ncbi:MAG: hypothetical protein AABY15_03095 [Nanoarchaeota archaeon]
MQSGSIVETVGDFEEVRRQWGLPYPKKGDALTVSAVTPHPNEECRKKGIVLLSFEEIPNLPGVCDKTLSGKPNFVELSLPDEIMELLQEPMKKESLKVIG